MQREGSVWHWSSSNTRASVALTVNQMRHGIVLNAMDRMLNSLNTAFYSYSTMAGSSWDIDSLDLRKPNTGSYNKYSPWTRTFSAFSLSLQNDLSAEPPTDCPKIQILPLSINLQRIPGIPFLFSTSSQQRNLEMSGTQVSYQLRCDKSDVCPMSTFLSYGYVGMVFRLVTQYLQQVSLMLNHASFLEESQLICNILAPFQNSVGKYLI